ncbi:M48 metallopeptidase family protein [Motilibacter aurantiacus]|uniref:M48 metallopeptidase family protein n=1 Tax=Motilibacter aurantiacus TaxID=2714955 RepID=UPI00140D4D24|nr:M48 family metallopeptidase [Motilibacter aurantiacus]NHC45646.1 M48 family metallopeptidase [Motilibacter aurantiacus]
MEGSGALPAEGDPSARPSPARPAAGAPATGAPHVEVRRSARRRRTVSAYRDGDTVVVLVPAGLPAAQERQWVTTMLRRLELQERRRRPTDETLLDRAAELSQRFLDGRAVPATVRWVDNQGSRWGSCTPADASIRLSTRLQGMPGWVLDYVLLHELAHLLEPGHGPAFWALLEAYPRTERARGFLEGVEAAGAAAPDAVDAGAIAEGAASSEVACDSDVGE